jgi:hypothetical protein
MHSFLMLQQEVHIVTKGSVQFNLNSVEKIIFYRMYDFSLCIEPHVRSASTVCRRIGYERDAGSEVVVSVHSGSN